MAHVRVWLVVNTLMCLTTRATRLWKRMHHEITKQTKHSFVTVLQDSSLYRRVYTSLRCGLWILCGCGAAKGDGDEHGRWSPPRYRQPEAAPQCHLVEPCDRRCQQCYCCGGIHWVVGQARAWLRMHFTRPLGVSERARSNFRLDGALFCPCGKRYSLRLLFHRCSCARRAGCVPF